MSNHVIHVAIHVIHVAIHVIHVAIHIIHVAIHVIHIKIHMSSLVIKCVVEGIFIKVGWCVNKCFQCRPKAKK
jgi:hypothetical protein